MRGSMQLVTSEAMATDPARLTTPERTAEDADSALRPKSLDEFIGQQSARENLRVFVNAARSRGEASSCGRSSRSQRYEAFISLTDLAR